MTIRNTTRAMREDPAEPLLALAVGMATGSAESFITAQEAAGQRELVNSDRLPSDIGDREAFEALGFTFGDPDPADPMFMPATLPSGWKREGSDHAMWSYVVDPQGRKRAAIFYKAAFYDRSAHVRLESLSWYVTKFVEYDGELVMDDEWATRDAVLAEMAAGRDAALAQAAEFRQFAADERRRDAENRAECGRIADGAEAKAAKYEAAIKALA